MHGPVVRQAQLFAEAAFGAQQAVDLGVARALGKFLTFAAVMPFSSATISAFKTQRTISPQASSP